MNLTHNKSRDYLVPVNPNINQQQTESVIRHTSREKQIPGQQPKINPEIKIQALEYTIQNLRSESEAMNAMIRTKNQEITNLKSQLKHQGVPSGLEKPMRQIYYLNNLTTMKEETVYKVSAELDQAIYQIKVLRKQRDDLQKYCEQLQQQAKTTSPATAASLQAAKAQAKVDTVSQQQHSRIVQQYQEHIASLASKLSTVHKLQSDVAHLNQERNHILADFQGMRKQLVNRVGYCEHLESQLRRMELELKQRGPVGGVNPADYQNLKSRNDFLEGEIVKLTKAVAEREDKIAEIQISKSGFVQVTKQAFQSMQTNIATLQEKLNANVDSQKKEGEKVIALQGDINRLTRELTEKTRKAESQSEKVQKLQNQKYELTSSLNRAKGDLKTIEKKLEEKSLQADKYKAQNEKNKKLAVLSQDFLPELQGYKKKAKQSDQLAKKLLDQLSKIENQYKSMVTQNQKAKQLADQSKLKWDTYDKTIRKQNETIMKLHQICQKRIQQIDLNIEKNIKLQDKLKEYSRQHDQLTDEIEQYIKENHYAKATELNV